MIRRSVTTRAGHSNLTTAATLDCVATQTNVCAELNLLRVRLQDAGCQMILRILKFAFTLILALMRKLVLTTSHAHKPNSHPHPLQEESSEYTVSGVIPSNMDKISGQGRTVAKSPQACRERCAKVSSCVYYSYWGNGGCHLSAGGDNFVVDDSALTGRADGERYSYRGMRVGILPSLNVGKSYAGAHKFAKYLGTQSFMLPVYRSRRSIYHARGQTRQYGQHLRTGQDR